MKCVAERIGASDLTRSFLWGFGGTVGILTALVCVMSVALALEEQS